MSAPLYLGSPLLESVPGLVHGFFTREGGVSSGDHESLNCSFGSDDETDRVVENRRRCAAALGFEAPGLFTLRQVHGDGVVHADRERPRPDREGDALVVGDAGLCVGVLTADCVPVLFVDPEARIAAAAHAGWKGAVGGVVGATVREMESRGARRERLRAAIGPSIRQPSYEVGPEVQQQVVASCPFDPGFLFETGDEGRYLFDLPGLVRSLCLEEGIPLVDDMGLDTYADEERFFSYRRGCHQGAADYGRQLSLIGFRA
jgi:YfiH family protein